MSRYDYLRLCDLDDGERFVLVRTGKKYTKGTNKLKSRRYICEPDHRTSKYEGHLAWSCKVKRIVRQPHAS